MLVIRGYIGAIFEGSKRVGDTTERRFGDFLNQMQPFNFESKYPNQEPLGWRIFWFFGKCITSLVAALTVQRIIQIQTGCIIPFSNIFWITIFIIVAIKMWS
jgi:hypothetical protein